MAGSHMSALLLPVPGPTIDTITDPVDLIKEVSDRFSAMIDQEAESGYGKRVKYVGFEVPVFGPEGSIEFRDMLDFEDRSDMSNSDIFQSVIPELAAIVVLS